MPPPRPPSVTIGPPGLAARLLEFAEELRAEGLALGTSELLDAFEALGEIAWTEPEDFRETMSVIVKHRTDLDVVAERVGVKLGAKPAAA